MMAVSDMYGSAPNRLSDLLTSLTPGEKEEIFLLTAQENHEVESASLRRFTYTPWEGVHWSEHDFREQEFVESEAQAASIVREWIIRETEPESLIIVMWGNLAVPAVALSAQSAAVHSEEVLSTSDDIWIFSEDHALFIEYMHDGRLTLARTPAN